MPRAIDHLVIPARDLAAQAELYRRLGFQVGARNRHPWGTENHIVQFDGAFLELIGLGEGFVAPAPDAAVYPFAGFIARFLERREGLAMLVLRSADAEADRARFAANGHGDAPRFDFARKGRRPDGGETEVAFSLAFAASPALPETGFFVCQQKFPQNFWSRAMQIHPNGALAIAGVVFAPARPDEAAAFLARFAQTSPARVFPGGLRVEAEGAVLDCLSREALAARFGDAVAAGGAPFALARIAVADLDRAASALDEGGVDYSRREGRLVVAPREGCGAALAFEAK